jgi:hypothetical protein
MLRKLCPLCFSKSVGSIYKSKGTSFVTNIPPICAKNPTSNETTNHSIAEESKAPEARYGLRSIPGRKIHSHSRKRRMKKGKGTKNPHPIVMPIYHDIEKGVDDGGRA